MKLIKRIYNYTVAKLFYTKFKVIFNSNMFHWGHVVYSRNPKIKNVVLGYKELSGSGFEYTIAFKPKKNENNI